MPGTCLASSRCTSCLDEPERFLRAGQKSYVNFGCPPDTDARNRWGDYSGAAADPDGVGIWIYGEFATNTSFTCRDGRTQIDAWGGQIGITQRALTNPVPHVSSLSPANAFLGTPGLTLTVTGADFMSGSVVRWNGGPRNTTFVSSTVLRAEILATDLQEEGEAQVTVFNPAPGGGASEAVGFMICAGSILWQGPGDGLWQTPSNWNTGNLPGPGDDVCIGPAARVVLNAGSHTIRSLRSRGALEITDFGSLSIANPSFIKKAFILDRGGTLTGSGDLTVEGMFVWLSGTLSGSGAFNANGGIALRNGSSGYAKILSGRTLNNAATAGWTDTSDYATINLFNGAVFNNRGTFDVQMQNNDSYINLGGIGSPAFNNAGTFRKSAGTGTTRIDVPFNNTGTVAVQSGTLSLVNGGTNTGGYTVDSGRTLSFGGNHTLNGTVEGAGTVRFDPNTTGTVNIGGIYNITGTTHVAGQSMTVNFNPGMTLISLGVLNLTRGTLNLSSGTPITQDTFTLSYLGTLTGSDSFTVKGLFTWSGGMIGGSGPFIADGGIALPTGTGPVLWGRTLTNNATATLTDTSGYGLAVVNGAVFDNQGTFDVPVDGAHVRGGGTPPVVFNNAGTFQKSAGAGTTRVEVPFHNMGGVSARSGTLSFTDSYQQSLATASTVLEGGALTSAYTMDIQAGRLSGFGTLTAWNVTNSGTASPGSDLPGTLNLVGPYTHDTTANLDIRIGGRAAAEFDRLLVTGMAALGGTLNVTLEGGFTPVAGDRFNIMTFGSRAGTFATTNLPLLPDGLAWDVQYSTNAVTLNVVAPAGPVLGAR